MAETALHLALRKIRRTLDVLEDSSSDQIVLPIFQSRLRRIESELRMILCFLDQLETRYNSNQVLVSWIAESQRLGYLVEEIVDVYNRRHLFGSYGSRFHRLARSIEARRLLFSQLIELEEELQHLSKLKENWVPLATDPKRDSYYIPITCQTANVSDHELVSDFTNEELVRFDVDIWTKLTAPLQDNNDCTSKAIAIWGPAGSGKTTLVTSVYEHHRRHFESYAWISMSDCTSAEDILTKIHLELHSDDKTTITNHEDSAVRHDAAQQEGDTDQEPLQLPKEVPVGVSTPPVPSKKELLEEALTHVVLDDMKVTDGISDVSQLTEQPEAPVGVSTPPVPSKKELLEEALTHVVLDDMKVTDGISDVPQLTEQPEAPVGVSTPTVLSEKELLKEALKHVGLQEKKFLIVLDDMKVADGISDVLQLTKPGSRVIIITRIDTVAEVAEERNRINLVGLNHAKAAKLFGKVVFGKRKEVPKDLTDKYKKVMEKFPDCKGLPQVIISVGATLCLNQSTESAFNHVQDQLKWVSENNKSLDDTCKCLYVAYINLPKHLKVCLLYCGMFPAGYFLQREKLIRLWVAEGFVKKQRESQVEEEIAEGYVMALISWGFLQHVGSKPGREGANLRMPIIVHDLVHSICRKEGFGIASEDVKLDQDDKNIRCLFTSKYPQDIGKLKHLPHLRTLIVSETGVPEEQDPVRHSGLLLAVVSALLRLMSRELAEIGASSIEGTRQRRPKFSYLTVLDLHGSTLQYLPYGIRGLFNLRYLGLSKTEVGYLPSSITELHSMQTLDLESTNIKELPNWIHKLARLRHILAGHCLKGVRASKNVIKLKELQTLGTVEASAEFTNHIVGSLKQIRNIGISMVEGRNSKTLFVSLSLLGSLSNLAVTVNNVDVVLPLGSLTHNQLKSLELSNCKLEDAVKVLAENLSNLVSLTLNNVNGITILEFEQNWFTKLRALHLQKVNDMVTLQIPDDALPDLKVLHVKSCTKLNKVGEHGKIALVNDVFVQKPELLARNDVAESSSSRA